MSSNKNKEFIDFSEAKESNIEYGGSEIKEGIVYQGNAYMLKFPKILDNGSLGNNCFSEYVASHIMASVGMSTHSTLLGYYNNTIVVACKDFLYNTGFELIDFASTGESSFDTDKQQFTGYSYQNIVRLLESHTKYNGKIDLKVFFWRLFVVDALLGNFDRHGMNWGFLRTKDSYVLAPVYDNGSCLFPRLQDEDLEHILRNEDEMKIRTYQFPTSQIKLGTKKSSYYDIISSGKFKQCTDEAQWLLSIFDQDRTSEIIDHTPMISDIRKEFYKQIIIYRFQHIFVEVFKL